MDRKKGDILDVDNNKANELFENKEAELYKGETFSDLVGAATVMAASEEFKEDLLQLKGCGEKRAEDIMSRYPDITSIRVGISRRESIVDDDKLNVLIYQEFSS